MINIKGGVSKEFELFFDIATDLLIILEPDGAFKKLNDEWLPVMGYSKKELEGRKIFELVHPDDLISLKSTFKILNDGKIISDFQSRLLCKNGEYKWLDWRIQAFENLVYVSAKDITQRKSSEQLLIESEKRFKDLFNRVKLISLIVDPSGVVTYINEYALEFLGYKPEEIYYLNAIDILINRREDREYFKHLLQSKQIPETIEIKITTKNSDEKIIKWSTISLLDSEGNLSGIACIGEDITDFKVYESTLHFKYDLFEKDNYENSNTLIQFTLDTIESLTGSKFSVFRFFDEESGTITLQTASSNTLRNSALTALLGQSYNISNAGIWSECIANRKPLIQNNAADFISNNNLPPGHPGITKLLIYPIIIEDKIVAIINTGNKISDYTQKDIEIVSLLSNALWNVMFRKMTEDALKESEEKLRALNITKDKFFSIISHDLKSPFQGLLGSLQILSSEFDYLSTEERRVLVSSIEKLSHYTYKLLENLLQWSRIQTEHMEYNIQIFNLKNAFTETVEMLKNLANNKSITIIKNIPEEFFVNADLNVTLTVFRNLLSNAIKFTNPNGEIKIFASQRDGKIDISVEDNGIGMTDEELANLFLIQNQQNRPGTNGETGTGLGLILCKEMLERIGGSIKVNSRLNKGTTFSFSLPCA